MSNANDNDRLSNNVVITETPPHPPQERSLPSPWASFFLAAKAFLVTWSMRKCFPPVRLGYVVVNFLFQLIFIFPLFWGMVMYANEFKTKEKQKLTEIKN